ncbi:hypothetical protein STEG23_012010, partial [Scotinomys teguina]
GWEIFKADSTRQAPIVLCIWFKTQGFQMGHYKALRISKRQVSLAYVRSHHTECQDSGCYGAHVSLSHMLLEYHLIA